MYKFIKDELKRKVLACVAFSKKKRRTLIGKVLEKKIRHTHRLDINIEGC